MNSDTKQHIIDEAKVIFGSKGFKGTSMSEIASAVGIKKPSLYYFFSNKEEIYFVVLITIMKEITDIFRSNMDNTEPEDLKLIIKKGLKRGLQVGSGLTTLKNTVDISDPEMEKEVLKSYKDMLKAIGRYLELCGVKEPDFAAQLLVDCQQMYMLRKECKIYQPSVEIFSSKLVNLLLGSK